MTPPFVSSSSRAAAYRAASLLALAALLVVPGGSPAQTNKMARVTSEGFVKVYKGPSQSSTIIAFAKKDRIYPV
ncbi:MAG: hypothetical protein GF418_01860, partial [Chitinivibrionales bacterium]|nr:hypothetical protein [Chitinivibrionales bacterium]MBD3394345.1 hypothetical protein [Chitinivibrionales bacterium]